MTIAGPFSDSIFFETGRPFAVAIQHQHLVEFGIKLLDTGDDAGRSPEIAALPASECRWLRARGRKDFIENIARELKGMHGRHGTEPRQDIFLR
jgi:hypothetical protein